MCGSKQIELKEVLVRRTGLKDISVEAEICLSCGERYFSRATAEKILAAPRHRKARIAR